jgi:DNA damage-binding protein 1
VTLLQKIRPATSATDHLFVGTDRYHYFTLSWDAEKKQLHTEKSYVDIAERTARDSQTGDRINVDPSSRFMTLECYEGVVNVIPIAHAGKGKRKAAATHDVGELGDPIPVRVPELAIRSSCFLHKRQAGTKLSNPEFAVLHEDSENQCRIKVRELEFSSSLRPSEEPSSAELEKCKEVNGQIELGASHLIALPPPIYGMLVVGETSISYVEEWEYNVKDEVPLDEATVFVAWCAIDDQRFVLADDYGKLYLLMVETDSRGEYKGLKIDVLGKTSRASTLVYLDGGRIFVGSHQGDSQLILIQPQSLEILQTFANIAPILDFTVMDMGNRSSDAPVNEFSSGQARIVTGSGAFQDGSLRSVRSGVGLEDRGDLGSLDAPITSVFGLHSSRAAPQVNTLVVSFVAQTRVFVFSEEGDVEEVDQYRGFNLAQSTLLASDMSGGRSIQVTSSTVLLTDAEGEMVLNTWQAPSPITAVSVGADLVLLSLQGATLVLLDLSGSSIQEHARREFSNNEQVSCIFMSPSLPQACVVGFWEGSKVEVLDLQTLKTNATESVAEEGSVAVPRSLIVAKLFSEQPATLFVGLADGNVVTYSIESSEKPFSNRKSVVLGTQQANFAVLPRADGLENVFATCEHPSLIYGSEGRIVYSAVTAEDTTCVCSFDSFEPYGRAIAIASNDQLKLATVDEERTTHVQDLYIEETVRRIAYSAELKGFGLGCIKRELTAGAEIVTSHFKFVDEVAFKELDSFDLNEDEIIEAVIRAQLDGGSGGTAERFVVGTSYLEEPEADSINGRIIILEVTEDRRLKLVAERGTKGACRCLAICQGHIVAALVKTVSSIKRPDGIIAIILTLLTGGNVLCVPRKFQHHAPRQAVLLPNCHRTHRHRRNGQHHCRHRPHEITLPDRIQTQHWRRPWHPHRSSATLRHSLGHVRRQRRREHLPPKRRRRKPRGPPT